MRFHRLCGAIAAVALVGPVFEAGCSGGTALPPALGDQPGADGGSRADATGAGGDDATGAGGDDATGAGGDDATSPAEAGTGGPMDATMGPGPEAGGAQDGSSGGASCGGCSQGQVCCEPPLACAGMCVPDCRLGGTCPSGLTCDSTTGACTPPGMMTDGGMRPPPDGGMPPPPDGGMKPPPDGGGGPPGDGGSGGGPGSDGGSGPGPDAGGGPGSDAGGGSVSPGNGTINGTSVGGENVGYAGNAVSIDDTTIVLGGPGSNCYGAVAKVYVWDGVSSWQLQQTLDDPNAKGPTGSNFNCFGGATAVLGDTAFVASPDDTGFDGIVYEYDRSGTTWTQSAKLADNTLGPAQFGYALAYDGTHLVVGAPAGVGQQGTTYAGYTEIYTKKGAQWSSQKLLSAPILQTETSFGVSVSLSGTRLAVGANGGVHDNYQIKGAAYSYQVSGTTWTFEAGVTGSDTQTTDGYGTSVAVSGDLMIVGAPGASPSGASSGAAYVYFYDSHGGQWALSEKLVPSDGAAGDQFGFTVSALSSTEVAIGARGASKAYLYSYVGSNGPNGIPWTLTTTYQSCPVKIGTNMATWGNLLVTGNQNDVVIDTSLMNPGCGGN